MWQVRAKVKMNVSYESKCGFKESIMGKKKNRDRPPIESLYLKLNFIFITRVARRPM